ncbi:MAG: hypothetical protein COB43_08985 [Oceanospirillales bacterium]|nr:MAG: hypothetical protein COB43_08985 [Oceanospirillales bacterium]
MKTTASIVILIHTPHDPFCAILAQAIDLRANKIPDGQASREYSTKRFKDSRIQGFKDSRIQGFKDSRIQGFKGSGFKGSGFKGIQGVRVVDFLYAFDFRSPPYPAVLRIKMVCKTVCPHQSRTYKD